MKTFPQWRRKIFLQKKLSILRDLLKDFAHNLCFFLFICILFVLLFASRFQGSRLHPALNEVEVMTTG